MEKTQIIRNSLLKAVSYETYRNLIDKYEAEGKSSGEEQTEERVYYTALNQKRYKRLELMNLFLTNGGKAIPIVVFLDLEDKVLAHWGSRPSVATKMVEEEKAKNGKLSPEFKEELQRWYNQDKGATIVDDFKKILETI